MSSSKVSLSNLSALYHVLWQVQDDSVLRQGLRCNVLDSNGYDKVHPFTFDSIDLSRHPDAVLPNGATSMLIRSEYELFFDNISAIERNFIVHGSAGIGKTHFLAYVLIRRLLACQPVTYQIDQPGTSVLCFTADGFFTLSEEDNEYHPLFQSEDVWHLVDSTHYNPVTHTNTDHTQTLMWGTCGKAIFTTFWPDSLGFNIEWSPGYDVALRQWMAPCTWDEIFAMSALTADRHNAKRLRWTYAHFGSNADICLQVSRHASYGDHYVDELECAHDIFWSLHPTLRELESQYNRSLFAVQPGDTRTEPLPYPVSQFASKLLAEEIVSLYPSTAKVAIDTLLDSLDTKEEGETFYRQTVVALMFRYGGTFELRCPDSEWNYQPADEGFFLRANSTATPKRRWAYRTQGQLADLAENYPFILHSPEHSLVHPGIDAVMFDVSASTVWLMQVTYGSPRPISPKALRFVQDTVRGSAYEPTPLRPWNLIFVTRRQVIADSFQLGGSRKSEYFTSMFWDKRMKPYVMQLRDTDPGMHSSSTSFQHTPYQQWGFPMWKSLSFPQRLANSLAHLVHGPWLATGFECVDQVTMGLWGMFIRTPGSHLLGYMTSEDSIVLSGLHMSIPRGLTGSRSGMYLDL
ncbi:uncharacterized protein EDB91DRAFT_1091780 [Suillus paluster]|uniref:uncharacterized protein n=1 Tax=Suillus paluster TaxID=48578 RepID=UPI001B875D31|nr:uncharacterized protein EDB91DRAFT_1091780 [Suillus paluster]KAG1756298.1 hypothetical protein EDB91DRAFT_1091780 [Suillus paluster]